MSRMISLFRCYGHARGRGGSMCVRVPLLAFALMLTAETAPQLAHAQAAAGAEWTTPSGTLQGTRYSSLSQITSANVGTLVEEFSFPTGAKASHEGQPLVVGHTMYVVTPFPNKLIALDLRTPGKRLWTFDPDPDEFAQGVACCDVVNRGAVYANGKIIYNVLDDTTVAVDAKTGQRVWSTRLGNVRRGETMTGPPIVIGDKVIVGNSGAELGVRGWVQALNVNTGAPVWKAYNTGPDVDVKIGANFKAFYAKDRGANLGSTTWGGTLWQQGGSTAWAWMTYDPALNLVYYGTANPGSWNPDIRPGDNKWGATIFARNPDTGQAVWAYQLTPHESWDYDAISENILVDLVIGGVVRKALVHFDKNGFAYTLDRATGQVLVAQKFANSVTWASHVDLVTGAPVVNPDKEVHEGVITKNICPSALGGKEWTPASFSPDTKLFYVPAIKLCNNMEALKVLYIAGTPFLGMNLEIVVSGNMGELIAWDAVNGTRAWTVPEPLPLLGGTLATAGNVVFYGTLDKKFKAVNAATGAPLFEKQLECGIVGNPISFLGADGKQRVAVYTGLGWLAGGFAGGACPARGEDSTAPRSGAVHVFKLP
jgi:lanthanide-dependent methanol dehydrogenase